MRAMSSAPHSTVPLDSITLRPPTEDDYARIIEAVRTWWDDVPALADRDAERVALVPRLFLQHFADTSILAETADGQLVGFLIGFLSQSRPGEAYIHFVGVAPARRRAGLGAALYARFCDLCRQHPCTAVHCITSVGNDRSIAFHQRQGFAVSDPIPDYDGPTLDRVAFVKYL
jgi:ribosomal protein S18 acetylase RimI-like enzyme